MIPSNSISRRQRDEILLIKKKYRLHVPMAQIACEHDRSRDEIVRIVRNRIWSNVLGPDDVVAIRWWFNQGFTIRDICQAYHCPRLMIQRLCADQVAGKCLL